MDVQSYTMYVDSYKATHADAKYPQYAFFKTRTLFVQADFSDGQFTC